MTENSVPTGDQKPIPSFQFSTASIGVKDQFDSWRDFMGPLYDVEPLAPSGSGFRAHAQVHSLGALQLSSIYNDPDVFSYSRTRLREFGMDYWSLSLVTEGSIDFTSGDGLKAATGDMYVNSYAVPFSGAAQNLGLVHVMLDRDEFHDVADALDRMIAQILTGPMSAILREFFISLGSHANELRIAEIPAVKEAFTYLLKAAVHPNADTLEAARLPIAATQLDMARRIINDNLKSPDLKPDLICSRMGISRRQLFYIFMQHGGVMKFITQRRLAACYGALVTSTDRKRISSIAYEYGFTNLSSFYRQFQARYGVRPSEARSAWLDGHTSRKAPGGTFADWLLRTDQA